MPIFTILTFLFTEADATRGGNLYVKINSSGCWAQVGYYSGSATKLNIGSGCEYDKGIIQHELLHAAGMLHQQSACYRDKYMSVYYQNIPSDKQHRYEYVYDYGSIMHYGEKAFSRNGSKTIDCYGNTCGQCNGLSIYDQYEIMVLYWGYYFVNSL